MIVRVVLISAFVSIVCISNVFSQNIGKCELQVSTEAYLGETIKLGYYYGTGVFLLDSLKPANSGIAISQQLFHKGIYVLQFPGGEQLEFMTDCETAVRIKLNRYNGSFPQVEGNAVAEGYNVYLRYIEQNNKMIDSLNTIINADGNRARRDSIRTQIATIRALSEERFKNLSEQYAGTLLGNFLTSTQQVRMTDLKNRSDWPDSLSWKSRLQFYQQHYLDNLVLTDPGLIYTPVLEDKIMNYLDKISEQDVRRKVERIDQIMQKPMHEEVYRFILEMLYKNLTTALFDPENEYLFLHIVGNYYLQGKAVWAGDKEIKNLSKEYNRRHAAALYEKAPAMSLNDLEGSTLDLHSVQSVYTLVVFWDHSCEYCMQALNDIKKAKLKFPEVDMQIYAVYTGDDLNVWRAFIEKKLPQNWVHVALNSEHEVLTDYNIDKLPSLFLLNENKIIIDKAFTAGQLEEFLNSTRKKK